MQALGHACPGVDSRSRYWAPFAFVEAAVAIVIRSALCRWEGLCHVESFASQEVVTGPFSIVAGRAGRPFSAAV